jgi:hypothetical protein
MHIASVDPANISDACGAQIRAIDGYWKKSNGIFRSDIPLHNSLLHYKCEADGEHLPKMGFTGPNSFLAQVMEGQFGNDASKAVQTQDGKFVQAVAPAFIKAAAGHLVADRISMEVTPPGHLKPYFVDYFRLIRRFQIGFTGLRTPKYFLSVLVVPTDEWRLSHHTEFPDAMRLPGRN